MYASDFANTGDKPNPSKFFIFQIFLSAGGMIAAKLHT